MRASGGIVAEGDESTKASLTLGGLKIARLLKTYGLSISSFARLACVSRLQIHRVMTGQTTQIGVDFAIAVSRASESFESVRTVIHVTDFASRTIGYVQVLRRQGVLQ